jgi:hypothetical protein
MADMSTNRKGGDKSMRVRARNGNVEELASKNIARCIKPAHVTVPASQGNKRKKKKKEMKKRKKERKKDGRKVGKQEAGWMGEEEEEEDQILIWQGLLPGGTQAAVRALRAPQTWRETEDQARNQCILCLQRMTKTKNQGKQAFFTKFQQLALVAHGEAEARGIGADQTGIVDQSQQRRLEELHDGQRALHADHGDLGEHHRALVQRVELHLRGILRKRQKKKKEKKEKKRKEKEKEGVGAVRKLAEARGEISANSHVFFPFSSDSWRTETHQGCEVVEERRLGIAWQCAAQVINVCSRGAFVCASNLKGGKNKRAE